MNSPKGLIHSFDRQTGHLQLARNQSYGSRHARRQSQRKNRTHATLSLPSPTYTQFAEPRGVRVRYEHVTAKEFNILWTVQIRAPPMMHPRWSTHTSAAICHSHFSLTVSLSCRFFRKP
ncbi:hypothetical protein BHM03_00051392 [Ensete ventricosum]|nr:hypothetical protein BHM03_00051392 [Ensete ventricosum]